MRRIEPTIGDTRLSFDEEAAKRRRIKASELRKRSSALDLLGTLALCLLPLAICVFTAVHAGLVPEQLQLGTPQLYERLSILGGLFVVVAAQVIGCIVLFSRSFVRGGLALLLPGYIFFALGREGLYRPVIGAWCIGLLAIIAGTVMLT